MQKEGRKPSKQGQTNNKAKQHSTSEAVTSPEKKKLHQVEFEPTTHTLRKYVFHGHHCFDLANSPSNNGMYCSLEYYSFIVSTGPGQTVHVGCAVLLCLPCCLFDLVCFFLPPFSSLIKTCMCHINYDTYMYINDKARQMHTSKAASDFPPKN